MGNPVRVPDFVLKAMDKETGHKSNKIGAGWNNPNGSISVVLDPGVGIFYAANILYTLFPNNKE